MASIVSLTPREAEALCASKYHCPPGYRVPTGGLLSVGGVPVPPVPLGVAREMAITNHYYFEPTRSLPPRFDYLDPEASDDDDGDYDDYSGDYYRARHEYD